MASEVDQLRHAIEARHHCRATFSQTIPVREFCRRRPIWEGVVHVFDLEGHPEAARAYAWSSATGEIDKRRVIHTVPAVGLIKTPRDAVRAVIVAEHHGHSRRE